MRAEQSKIEQAIDDRFETNRLRLGHASVSDCPLVPALHSPHFVEIGQRSHLTVFNGDFYRPLRCV